MNDSPVNQMPAYRLEMRGVVKTFPGVMALNNAQLRLRPGTVHALVGENGAGKSTLMKCMFGIYKMDAGTILYEGKPVRISDPLMALNLGIAMVHQELQPIPERSISENIYVGRYPIKRVLGVIPMVDQAKMNADTARLLKTVSLNKEPGAKLGTLSVSQMQSVEIAKAIAADCKVLILDEPTSSLTSHEVESLFEIIRDLKARGVSIVYISHKMDEILRVSDEVTIMRDGAYIGTWPASQLTINMIITRMVGRELTQIYPERHNHPGEVVFEVRNMTSANPRSFRNVSFSLRRGEILGVGGLVGAQRTELMEGIFGIRSRSSGSLHYKGSEIKVSRPQDAIRRKIALLTEDRRATGIFGVLSVADNVSIASLDQYLQFKVMLNDRKIAALVRDNIKRLSIKTPSNKTLIQSLSGGNQQKVLFSRWLANDPEILILDEPTRGIDVGAKHEIYTIIAELASQSKSIIMISSEMGELLGMSDRVIVMCEGRLTGIVEGSEATQENIMELATRFM